MTAAPGLGFPDTMRITMTQTSDDDGGTGSGSETGIRRGGGGRSGGCCWRSPARSWSASASASSPSPTWSPRPQPPPDPRADGIVVLTGDTARIDGALALLAEGRAERLLISGVNPTVGRETIAETGRHRSSRPALDCCVDIDHARDTIENASSTGAVGNATGRSRR